MNLDAEGNIWVCTFANIYYPTGLYHLNEKSIFFKDNYITQLDAETGQILFHKSITEILAENNLSNYLLKSTNLWDPIHHNDIQPALKTTNYYRKGDLFLSNRHLSNIIHYRPSTNEVMDVIEEYEAQELSKR
jgi:hypothetical protein